jgi:hypothetical protein
MTAAPFNPLALDATAAAARTARDAYRTVLALVLILETAGGLALLVAPVSVSRLLGLSAEAGSTWARAAGLLVIVTSALFMVGRIEPARAKLTNLIGVAGRLGLSLVFVTSGATGLLWVGLAEAAAALALVAFYFRYFNAEIQSRP